SQSCCESLLRLPFDTYRVSRREPGGSRCGLPGLGGFERLDAGLDACVDFVVEVALDVDLGYQIGFFTVEISNQCLLESAHFGHFNVGQEATLGCVQRDCD